MIVSNKSAFIVCISITHYENNIIKSLIQVRFYNCQAYDEMGWGRYVKKSGIKNLITKNF